MRTNFSTYLQLLSLILLGLFLVKFPLIFTTLTTDAFSLPKQFDLAGIVLLSFVLLGIKFLLEKAVTIRRTPFDLPIFIFLLAAFLSAILSLNRAESLVAFAPLLFSVGLYFLLTNFVKTRKAFHFLSFALTLGGALTSLVFILSYFKVYVLPWNFTHAQLFTPMGSLLDQAIYLGLLLALDLHLLRKVWKNGKLNFDKEDLPLSFAYAGLVKTVVILAGFLLTIYSLVKLQPPVILPFSTGFQVGLAAISQDSSRAILSLLFGSGFGTFATDFTRFKQAIFNQNQTLWTLTFFRSSSFVLELLATTGVVGFLSFVFLAYKALKQKPLFIPFAIAVLTSVLLPFSPVVVVLFFVLLGLFSVHQSFSDKKDYYDVSLALVTLMNGLVSVQAADARPRGLSRALPSFFFLLILILVGGLGFLSYRYALSNKIFQDSLVAASQNKGSDAYNKQSEAINLVNYSDAYQRLFSQTNIALANSLSNSVPKGSSPSAQTTQTIYTLIQQGINSARFATSLSPLSAVNWQNLSSIYRSLIGFGQNADSFAVLTSQQAVALDSTNPQEYLNLGGLYYQLKIYDKAAEQFRIAINLKPDFANAYYNLAHTQEQQGDTKGALATLTQVKELVKNDPANLKIVNDEIAALQKGQTAQTQQQGTVPLPPQTTPVPIPAPSTSPTPTPTK